MTEDYPRVRTCLHGWCPSRREACERCDKVCALIATALQQKVEEINAEQVRP